MQIADHRPAYVHKTNQYELESDMSRDDPHNWFAGESDDELTKRARNACNVEKWPVLG